MSNLSTRWSVQVSNNANPVDLAEATARLNNNRSIPSKSYGIQSIKNRLDISYEGRAQYFYTMDQKQMLTATIRIPRRYTRPDRSCLPKIKGVAL